MAYKSITDGIIFIEGHEDRVSVLETIKYKKTAYNQQLKTLDDIKKQLAAKAHKLNANAIMDFKYGQKSASFFKSFLLTFDDNVNWYAEGTAIVLDDITYNEYLKQISKQ